MPNDARAGLFVGMVVVIGLAIVYRGGGAGANPDAQIPGRQAPTVPADATNLRSQSETNSSSVTPGKEASGDNLIRKKDAADRVDGEPDTPDQQDEK